VDGGRSGLRKSFCEHVLVPLSAVILSILVLAVRPSFMLGSDHSWAFLAVRQPPGGRSHVVAVVDAAAAAYSVGRSKGMVPGPDVAVASGTRTRLIGRHDIMGRSMPCTIARLHVVTLELGGINGGAAGCGLALDIMGIGEPRLS